MHKYIFTFQLIIILFVFSGVSQGQDKRFYIEALPGAAYVLPSKLLIHQDGYEDIELRARYSVEPFILPPYYSIRAGFRINENTTIDAELNHLKLWLQNEHPDISRFTITHGYNQLWINLLKEYRYFDLRIGAGPVIAHPENTIRGLKLDQTGGLFNDGYHVDGISSQLAIQKKFFLTKFLYVNAESKVNVSFSKTEVVNGYARVSIFAIHALLGAGLSL